MGFLDNLFGGQQSPAEMELVQMLGGDPEQMRRNARRNGMLSLASALLGAGGENGVQSTGRALAQFGMSGRGMAPEMDRLVQSFQMRQQIQDMKANAEKQRAMASFAEDPANFVGVPDNVRNYVQFAAKNGQWDVVNSYMQELAKSRKPVSIAGGAAMQRAAAQLGFNPNDAESIPADRLPDIAKLAQQLANERARAGATNVNVAPAQAGEKRFFDTDAEEWAKQTAALQDSAVKTTQYAQNVAGFNSLLGNDPAMLPGELKVRELVAAVPGLGASVDKDALARQTAANAIAQKLGVEELANLSGPDTDKDYTRVMQIGPRLQMTPEGRKLYEQVMAAKAQQRNHVASFANQLQGKIRAGELTIEQAREALRKENERTQVAPLFESALKQFESGKPGAAREEPSEEELISKWIPNG